MNIESNGNSKDTAKRFAAIERTGYEFKRINGVEKVSIKDLPLFLILGKRAVDGARDDTLVILNPQNDLLASERETQTNSLNDGIETYIIQPSTFDVDAIAGYKALRNGETARLGRASSDMHRFDKPSNYVSNRHAQITKSDDGSFITIEDMNSTNGTYIGRPRVDVTRTKTTTQEWTQSEPIPLPMESLAAHARASSIASESHPGSNEDECIVDDAHGLYAVFDGVGGRQGGALASEAARNFISQHAGDIGTSMEKRAVGAHLRHLLLSTDDYIFNINSEARTTAVLAKAYTTHDGESRVAIAHTGDSRAYLLRNGTLKSLTTDHTPYRTKNGTHNAALQQERLAVTDSMSVISPEDIAAFYNRNVIDACLGGRRDKEVRVDLNDIATMQNDIILLTSDGIHDNLTPQEMQDILNNGANITDSSILLTRAASQRSKQSHMRSKKDDMTAVVINL